MDPLSAKPRGYSGACATTLSGGPELVIDRLGSNRETKD
jgi:hypothetical protein